MIAAAVAIAASLLLASPAELLSRLQGHSAHVAGVELVIDDVAGEGKPLVGVVERRGRALWLVSEDVALELRGPLARPRIAGPGYRVWVIGARTGRVLVARRIGVLAAPAADVSAAPARD
jgi:hypothetical protein